MGSGMNGKWEDGDGSQQRYLQRKNWELQLSRKNIPSLLYCSYPSRLAITCIFSIFHTQIISINPSYKFVKWKFLLHSTWPCWHIKKLILLLILCSYLWFPVVFPTQVLWLERVVRTWHVEMQINLCVLSLFRGGLCCLGNQWVWKKQCILWTDDRAIRYVICKHCASVWRSNGQVYWQ